MNTASHNPIGGASQAKPSANQLCHLPMTGVDEISRMSSARPRCEERDPGNSRSSRGLQGCAALVHELAKTTTAVLMNAQMLGWKLPPYSRLKRPLREIERNAQRGSELMKCLLRRLGTEEVDQANRERRPVQDRRLGQIDAVTAQEPGADSGNAENLPHGTKGRPAPGFYSTAEAEIELTSPCDGCPSTFPKKG